MKRNVLFVSLLLLAACSNSNKAPKEPQASDAPVVHVRTAILKASPFQDLIKVVGKTAAIRQSNVGFEVPGKVKKILVNENDYVKAGQTLAVLDDEQFQAAHTLAKSAVSKARNDFENSKSLYDSKVISKEQFDLAKLGLDNAEAQYIQARRALDNTALKAPFNGFVIDRNLEIGDIGVPGIMVQPPFTIADMSTIKIMVSVPESRIGFIKEGQKAEIQINSIPDRVFSGTIHRVGLAAQAFSNSFEVEVYLSNTDGLVKLGMVADVSIVLNEWYEELVVPFNLIHQDKQGVYLYVAEEGVTVRKNINIENFNGREARVTGEIKVGDELITQGSNDVRPGTAISIIGNQ